MALKLQDFIDIEQFQQLQDRLNEIYSFPSAIIDNDGTILTATAWQDICTRFHRQQSECEKECIKSDRYILEHLHEAHPAVSYRCPHGLVDNATPIIIDGVHYGNYFTGQFFLEPPDLDFFRAQAKRYGFEEEAYIEAVGKVPIWTRGQLDSYLFFIKGLIEVISGAGQKSLKEIETRKKIQESEARYQRITEGLTDYQYTVRIENGCAVETKQSPACERVTGYTPEEFAADPYLWITMVAPEDHDLVRNRVNQILQGEEISPIEHRIIRKNGELRWVRDTTILFKDESGNLRSYDGVVQDITERKQAEDSLRESEENHRALVQGLPDIVMRFDREGRHLFVSDNVSELVDLQAAQFIGKTHRELGFPEAQCRFWEQAVKGVFTSGEPFETEFTFKGKQGPTIFNWRLIPERDSRGEVRSVLSLSRDITAHRRAEENYRTLFREMLNGFALHELICDPQGYPVDYRFLAVNPAFERMTGLKGDDILGRTVLEVLPGTERHWIETYGKVALTGEPAFFENFHAGLDKFFEITAFCPRPNQFACIFSNITERKQAEKERGKLEGQLQQAQKMESVGRLAGGVAHDFNNMLTVILGCAHVGLLETDPTQTIHTYLTEISKAAERSADLTRQLLAFARKQTIAPKVLDLNSTITGMLKMLQRLIGEDILLTWQPAANLWQLKMDPSQIDQILANLCVNARDAISDVGRITIETRNCTLDEDYCANHAGFFPGEYVLLVVSDNGHGMSRETTAHIFEPFFTTKDVGTGTGLGLATIYGIVKQNSGFINVYSEPEQGTSFSIYLPRHKDATGHTQAENRAEPARRGQETILLVEDEPAILKMTAMILEKLGYTVLAAISPEESIRQTREHTGMIHLLMTDVVMPGMNGRELSGNLQSLYPHLKSLFMSGYTANVIAHHGVLDEDVHFIQKPFSMHALAAKVREVLDHGQE